MELIGQGGVWKVYSIGQNKDIFRIPNGSSEFNINRFIANHTIVKELALPTLVKAAKYELRGHSGIICENVNFSDEKIYVSHNSLYSDSHKLVDSLSNNYISNNERRASSIAEAYRYINKIKELSNFQEFVQTVNSHLKKASENGVLIEFDSFFFGTQKYDLISQIDYKIVDLDHIFKDKSKSFNELYELNMHEFHRALRGFLKYFVCEPCSKTYLDYFES